MATYEYDEGGVMAAYFLITILALILVPMTLTSFKTTSEKVGEGCDCGACSEHRKALKKEEGGLLPKISRRGYFLLGGWSLFVFVCWRVSGMKIENAIYNPFEILEIKTNTPDKEIKAHFKKLSKLYHPDKVKPTAELTIEAIQDRFVQLTKAYKALTDEKIKENWIKYNHPDGPQSTTMGIALPSWIVAGKNNIWVLGAYGLIFGGALPALVGRWWFGSRQKTKDGVHAQSASTFFKSIREESTMEEVVAALGKAYKWDLPPQAAKVTKSPELDDLESQISTKLGSKWAEIKKLTRGYDDSIDASRLKGLVLLHAHLHRIPVKDSSLRKQQKEILLQTPVLLNALLNASISRNWLFPTVHIMRLNAHLAQALPTNAAEREYLLQLPSISTEDLEKIAPEAKTMTDLLHALETKNDSRASDVKRAIQKWGKVEIVDAAFKVIGERVITPSSIIYLHVKLRLSPPGTKATEPKDLTVDETKKLVQRTDELDEAFLVSRNEAEELPGSPEATSAHAPYWPGTRKPSWWVVLADDKTNRVVVPPLKIGEIPYAGTGSDKDRDYRSYKIQFQGPPNTGLFTWKVYLVSDTFVGEEVTRDIALKIEDPPQVEEADEDEISDPDEDSLAGQMAAMRGGSVKKRVEAESDDESGTDDDEDEKDSDSDSDSD
ncbi:hypothetical protein CVT24_006505 [Panaeolus cyanescens]|uniref:J domain-containing protein n=1 Tax=Panaeolus cyanescens TaxID=181874 RepID=A0A409VZU3_9AGAR|nr:hypothetical protein CVT24_006505 [Panaeolus cyanescens]